MKLKGVRRSQEELKRKKKRVRHDLNIHVLIYETTKEYFLKLYGKAGEMVQRLTMLAVL